MITGVLLCQRAGNLSPEGEDDDDDLFSFAARITCKPSTDMEMTIK
jgi:hypothetical protein